MICSCRCWESSGSWNQFEVYRRNKLTWASHRLGNCHWIRTLNHLLPLLRLLLLHHLLFSVVFFFVFFSYCHLLCVLILHLFSQRRWCNSKSSALFISLKSDIICADLYNPVHVRVLKCTAVVSRQSVANSNVFPVCSSPSLTRNQSLGTWLRSSEAPMSTGLCMLVMATLFTWQHHQAVSPLSGLLLSNPDLE